MYDAKIGQNNHSKYDIYKFAVGELTSLRIVQSVIGLLKPDFFLKPVSELLKLVLNWFLHCDITC